MQMTSSSSSKPKKNWVFTHSVSDKRQTQKKASIKGLKLTNVHSIVSFISIRCYFTTVDPRPFEEVNCISDKSPVRNHIPY